MTRAAFRFTATILLTSPFLTGCFDVLSVIDDAVRDLDRKPPEVVTVDTESEDLYDTMPVWAWRGDLTIDPLVFRYRLNGSDWNIIPDITVETDDVFYYAHTLPLMPGTYQFEVQQRNNAGSWSDACSHIRAIQVRPPEIVAAPDSTTNDVTPYFAWQQWADGNGVQHGVYTPGLFSWRLQKQVESQWLTLDQATDQSDTAYQVAEEQPLSDALHRFCVSELNQSGARSEYACWEFVVDSAFFLSTTVIINRDQPFIEEFPHSILFYDLLDADWYADNGGPDSIEGIYDSYSFFWYWYVDVGSVTEQEFVRLISNDGVTEIDKHKNNHFLLEELTDSSGYRVGGLAPNKRWRLMITSYQQRPGLFDDLPPEGQVAVSEAFLSDAGEINLESTDFQFLGPWEELMDEPLVN